MAVTSARVSVATTATALSAAESDSRGGESILIKNKGAAAVDLGPAGVTSGNGYLLEAGDVVSFDLDTGESLYAIAASGTVLVHVLRVGV